MALESSPSWPPRLGPRRCLLWTIPTSSIGQWTLSGVLHFGEEDGKVDTGEGRAAVREIVEDNNLFIHEFLCKRD